MFVKIDKKSRQEVEISSEAMVTVLEADLKPKFVDDALMDLVSGEHEHSNREAIYKYIR
ncbi:MAG: hypothetical protein R8K49_01155 [Mariprofundaceae bacterium]